MKVWKRNAVVAAIVLFVCVAVYLNWSYGRSDTASSMNGDSTKTLGEAELVAAETGELAAMDGSGEIAAPVELAEEPSTEDYFAAARLSRQEARDEALSMLQSTVDDPNAAAEVVASAGESIEAMAAVTLTESEIEGLVTAKGYTDCVTYIGDNSVSVVVAAPAGDLQAADVAKITDIVMGETDFSASQVKIIQAE